MKGTCGGRFHVIKHKNRNIIEYLLKGKVAKYNWIKKASRFSARADNYSINATVVDLETLLDSAKRTIKELRQFVPTWKKDEVIEYFHDAEHKKDSTVPLGSNSSTDKRRN